MKQIETYNSFLPKPKKVKIYRCGAEDLLGIKLKILTVRLLVHHIFLQKNIIKTVNRKTNLGSNTKTTLDGQTISFYLLLKIHSIV